jgi:hypothetical protein
MNKGMDTRFWGPSGWKLLHLIAASPGDTKVYDWFQLLPYVLPCKFCRTSLQEYYGKLPLTLAIVKDHNAFSHWLYKIHNMVNEKLRSQGILKTPNPSWPSVRDEYRKMTESLCDTSPMVGWDFLASIAYTTPTKGIHSKPMDFTGPKPTTLAERNQYNMLTPKERIAALSQFWTLIPSILPCKAWRSAWSATSRPPPLTRGRGPVSCWLWDLEASVCSSLRCPAPHSSLPALKSELNAFESACGSKTKRKTCRAKRDQLRRAAMTRRIQTGGALVH